MLASETASESAPTAIVRRVGRPALNDHTGHVIFLERHNVSGTGFHVVQVGTLGAGSSFSITHAVYDPGTKVFRVTIPGGPENEGASSPPFMITVTPAPAAALTPESPGNSSLPSEGQS